LKGKQAQEASISLLSEVYGKAYFENKDRVTKGNITGRLDIIDRPNKTIRDVKTSWNPKTFMGGELTSLYEWQGRAYMHLYDCETFHLDYCLVDCPQDVYDQEYSRFCFRNGIVDDTMDEYQDMIAQFDRNLIYTTNPAYSKEERVKTFTIYHDQSKINWLLERVELAKEYYSQIK